MRPFRPSEIKKLLEKARYAATFSYSPFSRFRVGAAVKLADGRVFTGTNIENASYGLTVCAERVAVGVAKMARPGKLEIVAVAVVGSGSDPVLPCGACRQVLAQFMADDAPVFCGTLNPRVSHEAHRLGGLLPYAFRFEPATEPNG